MKFLFIIACSLFMLSCASSETEVKHTVVIKGIKDTTNADAVTSFSVKIYALYAGSDCSNLTLYRRFGKSGKYFEFFTNNGAVVASARPPDNTFGCIAIEISTRFRATCNSKTEDLDATFAGGTDINGDATNGPDGQPKVALFLTPSTPLDTTNSRDFYFVTNNIADCTTAPASGNFTLSETNPLL